MSTRLISALLAVGLLAVLLTPDSVCARSLGIVSRRKRVSDQRLAELETILGLSKIKGIVITVPVAFGVVDPAKIGRRRRSTQGDGFNKLKGILGIYTKESIFPAEEKDTFVLSTNDINHRQEANNEY